jgi:isoleucyl-tRNA synthetase
MSEEKSAVAKKEEETLKFWQENNIFEKTLAKEAPQGEFVFYDGPPFATGLPHYGHILPGTIKDIIPRFRTMQGYHVDRQWGWDTHGLPLENQVEDHLGLETKKDIYEYGIEKFNQVAKEFVLQYAEDWKKIIPRTGRWVDMEDDYRTMDANYTESIWWAFNELSDRGLIYEGFKAMHICPRCETPLSNFEVNQGYVEQKDIAVTVKLPLADDPDTNLLIWTTTPWTLPGNMAVAVNPELEYIKVTSGGKNYVVAKEMAETVFEDKEYEIAEEFLGEELVGKTYQPPFGYFQDKDFENKSQAWQVYGADFVTLEEGTGLVHIAPAFGSDDLALAEKEGIPIVHHVTESGEFTQDITDFAGMKVKPHDEGGEEHLTADIEILKYLLDKELMFAKDNIHHQYPLCWRCDTPLLNYVTTSWFVEVSKFKDELVEKNKQVGWTPKAIGSNRFGNWLEGARDWAISRERFWGAPLPVWKSEDGETVEIIKSLNELKKKQQNSNNFYLMRHGEADHNVEGLVSSKVSNEHHLTEKGEKEVTQASDKLQGTGVDILFVSPFTRSQETARLLAKKLGLTDDQIITDEHFTEYRMGDFNGKPLAEWHQAVVGLDRFNEAPVGAETYSDVRRRVMEGVFSINEKYKNKNILIISHGLPLHVLHLTSELVSDNEIVRRHKENGNMSTASIIELDFWPYPHNNEFELDLHRPYIDEIVVYSKTMSHFQQ